MCAPLVIPALTTAVGVGGASLAGAGTAGLAMAGLAGLGQGLQVQSGISAAEYNEKLASQQQQQLEAEAKNVRIAGSQEAAKALTESERIAARNRVTFASGGVATGTGTPGQVSEDVAEIGQLEQMQIINNASRSAFGLEVQGRNLVESAKLKTSQARSKVLPTLITSGFGGYAGFAG